MTAWLVVILLMSVGFNGWNGIQLDVRLTSAARAGALQAASDLAADMRLNPAQPPTLAQINAALDDATAAINAEENSTIYQHVDPTKDYVTILPSHNDVTAPGERTITINVVTITISQASVALVPVVGNISVTAHAAAEYS